MKGILRSYRNNRDNLSIEEILNVLLLSIVLVMPFIISNIQQPYYSTGKVYYIYTIAIIILLIIMKKGKSIMGQEEKISYWFLISIVVVSLLSEFKDISIWGNPTRFEGMVMYCVYILLFVTSIRYLNISKKIMNMIMVVPNIMGIYCVFQYYGVDPIFEWLGGNIENLPGAIGTIGNRNFSATYILIFVILNLSIYILKDKKIALLNLSIQFSALLCCMTRSTWVAFFVVCIVGLFLIINKKCCVKRGIIAFLLLSSIFIVINYTSDGKLLGRVGSTIKDSINITENSGSSRIKIWKNSLKIIKDHPIIGTGPDTLLDNMMKYYPNEVKDFYEKNNKIIDKSHNEYIEYWVSCGIITLIMYLILMCKIGINLFKRINHDRYKVIFLIFIGYNIQSFFNISVISVAPIWWIFLGYCVKCYREKY